MNLTINDFDVDNVDLSKLNTMNYLHDYLDDSWKITKHKHAYILKKDRCKILIGDNIVSPIKLHDDGMKHTLKYILCFLYNVLNNGWSIKKAGNKYILLKKHEGKSEYFSDEYINSFMKEQFNSNLIK